MRKDTYITINPTYILKMIIKGYHEKFNENNFENLDTSLKKLSPNWLTYIENLQEPVSKKSKSIIAYLSI